MTKDELINEIVDKELVPNFAALIEQQIEDGTTTAKGYRDTVIACSQELPKDTHMSPSRAFLPARVCWYIPYMGSDVDYLQHIAQFYYQANRWCVAASRPKTKTIFVGSSEVSNARPHDCGSLGGFEKLRRTLLFCTRVECPKNSASGLTA